jgi:hypothetical protein
MVANIRPILLERNHNPFLYRLGGWRPAFAAPSGDTFCLTQNRFPDPTAFLRPAVSRTLTVDVLIAGLLKVLPWKPPSFLVGTSTSRFEAGQLYLAQTERWVSSFENTRRWPWKLGRAAKRYAAPFKSICLTLIRAQPRAMQLLLHFRCTAPEGQQPRTHPPCRMPRKEMSNAQFPAMLRKCILHVLNSHCKHFDPPRKERIFEPHSYSSTGLFLTQDAAAH